MTVVRLLKRVPTGVRVALIGVALVAVAGTAQTAYAGGPGGHGGTGVAS